MRTERILLRQKKFKGCEDEFAYCTEGTYFNELNENILLGGQLIVERT